MDEPAVYQIRTHFSLPPLEVQRPALNTSLWMSLLVIKFVLTLAFPSGGNCPRYASASTHCFAVVAGTIGHRPMVDEVFPRFRAVPGCVLKAPSERELAAKLTEGECVTMKLAQA